MDTDRLRLRLLALGLVAAFVADTATTLAVADLGRELNPLVARLAPPTAPGPYLALCTARCALGLGLCALLAGARGVLAPGAVVGRAARAGLTLAVVMKLAAAAANLRLVS